MPTSIQGVKPLSIGLEFLTLKELFMKKLKSLLLTLTMLLAIGLVFQPTQVRAESGGGPQNTSNSQSSGSSAPTLSDIIRILITVIRFP